MPRKIPKGLKDGLGEIKEAAHDIQEDVDGYLGGDAEEVGEGFDLSDWLGSIQDRADDMSEKAGDLITEFAEDVEGEDEEEEEEEDDCEE